MMTAKQIDRIKKWMSAILLILCLIFCIILFKAYLDGKFDSVETLRNYIAGYGWMAPLILTAIQAAQVVFPILPGFLGCLAGAAMFGWMGGFWCNYIGISIGSLLAFLIARKCGKEFVCRMFPGERYKKWSAWAAESKAYTILLLLIMILPLFPDDFFCYFTGITNMRFRKFTTLILVGKPWCILAYCVLFSLGIQVR